MVPVVVVCLYLAVIAVIGSIAFRKSQANTEDFFLANRAIGSMVFFLSIFATNMTAFAILGSSGQAYRQGIGIYGLMASSSGLVIPLTIFLIGTRLWAIGKRFGHQTQVAFFRDRWECSAIGTVIFLLSVVMLVPYMIISIMGGGRVLHDISEGRVAYWLGCALVALVVTLNVFFGGMRGTVWVNIFQTTLFLVFGAVALAVISQQLPGGFSEYIRKIAGTPETSYLVTRERMSERYFWSYSLIPLSSIMFPHMAIMCFAAQKVTAFRRTVVLYPLAIMAVWLPCVFLGVLGTQTDPGLKNPDGILLHMLTDHAPALLAGILGAGIISAVMGSDTHQVLAVSTMFTKDVFGFYGGTAKYGERGSVIFARGFILLVTALAYIVALVTPVSIFELAVRFAFSGFAALAPVMVAALFWKRSTKYGALASTLWVAAWLVLTSYLQHVSDGIAPKPGLPPVAIFSSLGHLFERSAGGVMIYGFLPVVPMVLGSALLMAVVSWLTPPPSRATIEKYFPRSNPAPRSATDGEPALPGSQPA
jgi:SSS family solute:Na+ symporter